MTTERTDITPESVAELDETLKQIKDQYAETIRKRDEKVADEKRRTGKTRNNRME